VPVKLIPSWTTSITVDINDKVNTGDVSDGYFYMLHDRQSHTAIHETYVHEMRKIISDEGVQNGSDLAVEYNPSYQKIFFHFIKIIRNGQTIDRTKETQFKIIQPENRLNSYIFDGTYVAMTFLSDTPQR